jgi:hypothetical protein
MAIILKLTKVVNKAISGKKIGYFIQTKVWTPSLWQEFKL